MNSIANLPVLARIRIYPVKALNAVEVTESKIATGGALAWDRAWALVDPEGRLINGKRYPAVHRLRAEYRLDSMTARFGDSPSFSLLDGWDAALPALSRYFGFPVRVEHDATHGLPDDTDASGPTVVTSASLLAVCRWFPPMTVDNARDRFRANLEFAAEEPFWEDRLRGPFRVGDVEMTAVNPCQRCAVPSRDPETGEEWPGFQKRFALEREASIPEWAHRDQFNHFYRFTVNTRIDAGEAGKTLRVGDLLAPC